MAKRAAKKSLRAPTPSSSRDDTAQSNPSSSMEEDDLEHDDRDSMTQDEVLELNEAILTSRAEEESRSQWAVDAGSSEPVSYLAPLPPPIGAPLAPAFDIPAGQKMDYS
eukprot:16409380-Heterocapsa_arctica.AAC.1